MHTSQDKPLLFPEQDEILREQNYRELWRSQWPWGQTLEESTETERWKSRVFARQDSECLSLLSTSKTKNI